MKNFFFFIFIATLLGVGVALAPLITLAAVFASLTVVFIAKNPERGIILTAFFLPFERLGSLEFFGLTIRLSQILIIITFFIWLMRGLWLKKISLSKNPLIFFIGAFLLANLLSLINAVNLSRSLTVFLYMVFTLSVVVIVPLIITDKNILQKVIRALLWSFVIVTLFGLYQFVADMAGLPPALTGLRSIYTKDILGFTRVQSTALEPLYFGNYLLIPLSIILVFFLRKVGPWKQSSLVIFFILGITNLILTVSRGGYIALGVVTLLILLWHGRKLLTVKNMIFLFVAVVTVAATVLMFFSGVVDDFIKHTVTVFEGASYEERRATIDLAVQTFWQHPVIGIGVGGFGPLAARQPFEKPADGWKIVNNETLEILAETGLGGFISFVLLVAAIFLVSWHTSRQYFNKDGELRAILFALAVSFTGILIQYQTFSVLYIMHVWFVVGLIVAVWNIIGYGQKSSNLLQ